MRIPRIIVLLAAILVIFSLPAVSAPFPDAVIKPLALMMPRGGEVWQGGIERTITWKYIPTLFKAQTVKILLIRGNTVIDTIAADAPVGTNGQGSFKWRPVHVAPGANYKLRIIGNTAATEPQRSDNDQTATSGVFTITEKANIIITFPANAGQSVEGGQQVDITWDYTGDVSSNLYLRLMHRSDHPNGGLFSVLVDPKAPSGSNGHGSYQWVIPKDLPASSTYFFDIGCDYAGIGASGKDFTINKPKPISLKNEVADSLTMQKPKPGEANKLDPQPEPPSQ